jgi:hypothetical protein
MCFFAITYVKVHRGKASSFDALNEGVGPEEMKDCGKNVRA